MPSSQRAWWINLVSYSPEWQPSAEARISPLVQVLGVIIAGVWGFDLTLKRKGYKNDWGRAECLKVFSIHIQKINKALIICDVPRDPIHRFNNHPGEIWIETDLGTLP